MKKAVFPLLLLLLLLWVPSLAEGEPVISEIMAANATWKNGSHSDWVEIANPGKKALDLSGWGLSDSAKNPFKWVFPDGTKVKGGECLLVYCTGGEEADYGKGALYASFKLSQDGEKVVLTSPDESVSVRVDFPLQYANVSWALGADGEWGYAEKATPGAKNSGKIYAERTDRPSLLLPGGFYQDQATVCAVSGEGLVRYTLDGETPTAKSPVLPEEGIVLKQTSAFRCAVFADGKMPSETADATYFISDPSPVPVIALTTDDKYLFNKKTGALVRGESATSPNYEKEWEYPVYIEYYTADGECLISQRGSFTAAGHSARQNAQKSIAIYARSVLGEDTFAFNPFPNRDYESYHALLLRSANSDAFSTRLRDPVISSLAENQDICYQDALAIQVYINGRYWGHYNLREKINKYFVAQWEGIEDEAEIDRIDILSRTGSDSWVQNGDNADWVELCEFCKKQDLNVPENLAYVTERLDIDSLFTHAAFEIIIGNSDITNVRVYRVPGGKWKYLLFDVEAGFQNLKESPLSNYIKPVTAKIQAFRHEPLNALLNVPEMKAAFLTRFARLLEESFRWSYVEAHFAPWEETVGELLERQYERWPYLTLSDWRQNVNAIRYYAKKRPIAVVDMLAQRMKLTEAEKNEYFAQTLAILKADAEQ